MNSGDEELKRKVFADEVKINAAYEKVRESERKYNYWTIYTSVVHLFVALRGKANIGRKWRNRLLKKSSDVETLYQNYVRYQTGDDTALAEVFVETGKTIEQNYYIQELNEKYKITHADNVLDAELVEDEIQQRQKERKLKVKFSFQCLNDIANKAKLHYSKESINTGYTNGKKIIDNGYKKFHEGKYDVSELEEIMQEIVIKLYQGKLSGSKNEIVDGTTLLQNIKYYLTIEMEKNNETLCNNIPEIGIDNKTGKEISYFDLHSENVWLSKKEQEYKWLFSKEQTARLLLYADCLKWLQKNDVHNLFNTNSYNIHAIINSILKNADVFEEGETGSFKLVKQERLKDIIERTEKRGIEERNISSNLKYIEQKLIDHLLYSLNYWIGEATGSNGEYKKESERFLYEYDKKAYVKLFTRRSMQLYDFCQKIIYLEET